MRDDWSNPALDLLNGLTLNKKNSSSSSSPSKIPDVTQPSAFAFKMRSKVDKFLRIL